MTQLSRFRYPSIAAALLALAAGPLAAQAPRPPATPITPALAAETFDSAWASIDRTLWDTAVANGAWRRARAELRPRAASARTVEALRGVIDEALHRLPYSHFDLIPGDVQQSLSAGDAERTGDAGVDVRLVDGRIVVTRVDAGGPAAAAGVRPGWVVDAVGTTTARQLLAVVDRVPGTNEPRKRQLYAWMTASTALRGAPGSTVRVRFLDGANRTVTRTLALRTPATMSEKFGNLPRLDVRLDTRRAALPGGGSAGVVRFNYWMPVVIAGLNAAVDSFRALDGMVIDLRGNLGGAGLLAPGFAGHFVDRADTLGVMRMRTATLNFVINPRRVDTQARPVRPYAGPVAVLTDAMSASTSEFFAGGLRALNRVRVFGEPTAGQALPAWAQKLPNGDVLMHAVADFTGPGGVRWEGGGVVPDVAAPPTRAALLAGRDPALDAALEWIATQRRAAPPR
ncbi:MAG TPA: S41 family peptidase [Longimicrobium sp.]|nr:S41 family peptidase [Longimicrobium sp.]